MKEIRGNAEIESRKEGGGRGKRERVRMGWMESEGTEEETRADTHTHTSIQSDHTTYIHTIRPYLLPR